MTVSFLKNEMSPYRQGLVSISFSSKITITLLFTLCRRMRGARTAFINTQTRSHSSSTYKARRLCGKGTHLRSHSDLSLSSWLLNFPCETLWFAGQRQLKTEPRKLSPVRYSCVRFRCQLQDVTVFRIRHMGWRKHRLFYLNTLTHGNLWVSCSACNGAQISSIFEPTK